ncbi:MAG: hypothetical protein AB7P03_13200 [Kofleriaceae bacterium]
MRSKFFVVGAVALAGCGSEEPQIPAVFFSDYYHQINDEPLASAHRAAQSDPSNGFAYTFPVQTIDVDPGTEVRLLFGRSTNDPGYPSTTGDDVILRDQVLIQTAIVDDDGHAEFPGLSISTDASVTSDTSVIPKGFLCGLTVVAVRAYEVDGEASRFLASSFLTMTSECAPP